MDLLEPVPERKIRAGALAWRHGVKLREKAGIATEPEKAQVQLPQVLGDGGRVTVRSGTCLIRSRQPRSQ
jgi:hypothetical protein